MKCERCGEPATVEVADIQESEPVSDGGKMWSTWRVVGTHSYCKAHEKGGLILSRDGNRHPNADNMRTAEINATTLGPILFPPER